MYQTFLIALLTRTWLNNKLSLSRISLLVNFKYHKHIDTDKLLLMSSNWCVLEDEVLSMNCTTKDFSINKRQSQTSLNVLRNMINRRRKKKQVRLRNCWLAFDHSSDIKYTEITPSWWWCKKIFHFIDDYLWSTIG
jgi:hypothetical protein